MNDCCATSGLLCVHEPCQHRLACALLVHSCALASSVALCRGLLITVPHGAFPVHLLALLFRIRRL
jgi:hypothetical protein